jgi:hypothetical protein
MSEMYQTVHAVGLRVIRGRCSVRSVGDMTDSSATDQHFDFAFAASYRLAALVFGVTPATTAALLGPEGLRVRFGAWRLRTPLANIAGAETTGGFSWIKTAGPAHLSFADRGVTFATNGDAAVCLTFHTPVAGIDPTHLIKHPGATLTVADPAAFVAHLEALRG